MTIISIVALVVLVWGQRLLGAFAIGPALARRPELSRAMGLIPVAVVVAVIAQLTIASGQSLTVDARLAGLAVAGVLVWRKAPFIVVVLAAAAVTALTRAF